VVVVRYFGGTKLGVGGLISAYKIAAEDALNKCTIIEEEVRESFRLMYEYESTPDVMRLVKDFDLMITDQSFTDECIMDVTIHLAKKNELVERVELLTALRHKIKLTPHNY
jgi:putative IMPACT (imprinted ancient) family translation regulator